MSPAVFFHRYDRSPKAALAAPVFLLGLALFGILSPAAIAQDTGGAQPQARTRALVPPEAIDDLRRLRDELRSEADALRPATRPTDTAPQTRPAVSETRQAASDLLAALEQLLGQVDEQFSLRTSIAALNNEKAFADLSRELARIQQDTSAVEAQLRLLPSRVTNEEVSKAIADFQALEQDVNARSASQVARSKALAAGRQEKTDATSAVAAAQAKTRQQLDELNGLLATAKSDDERALVRTRMRRIEIEAAIPPFRRVTIDLRDQRDIIVLGREERRLSLLKALVARTGEWRDSLLRIQSSGEREAIQYELDLITRNPGMVPDYERLFWELRALQAEAREKVGQRTPPVYAVSSLEGLKQRIATESGYWELFMSGLEQRPRVQVKTWYGQAQNSMRKWNEALRTLRKDLNRATDEHRETLLLIDDYDERLRDRRMVFREVFDRYVAAHPDDTKAEQLRQDLLEARRRHSERIEPVKAELAALRARLEEAVRLCEGFLSTLEKNRSRLYWRQLYASEQPIWSVDYQKIKREWTNDAERIRRARDLDALKQSLAATTTSQWARAAGLALLAAVLGIWASRRAAKYARRVAESISAAPPGEEEDRAALADRLHLFLARFVRKSAPVSWPALALAAAAVYGLSSPLVWPVGVLLLLIAGMAIGVTMVRVLFAPGKPRLRLLRCSNRVAAHYRKWAMLLWFVTLVMLPVPLALWALGWSAYTADCLWSVYKIAAILTLLLFGVRKQLVLRVVGRPEQVRFRGGLLLVSAAYPLLWAVGAALLGLELAGYGPLTTYVLSGLAQSVATIVAAILLSRYVGDLGLRWQRRLAPSADATQPGEGVGRGQTASLPDPGNIPPAAMAGTESPPDVENLRFVLAAVTRIFPWAAAVATFMLIMNYWSVRTLELETLLAYEIGGDAASGRRGIVVGRVLAAIGTIVASLWASREIRNLLNSRIYPVYTHVDRSARAAINNILHYFIVLLGIYFALYALNVPLGAVTVVLGTVGLGVGLGLQPLIVNFISGLLILFERHVRVGDIVEIDGKLGEVTGIRMRSTGITTYDNIDVVIPNSDFITQRVVNWTLQETRVRGRIKVGVSYDSDPERVKQLLLDIARRNPQVLYDPAPVVTLDEFGANTLDFSLTAWFADVAGRGQFLGEVRFDVMKVFKESGIEIPPPQMSLSASGGRPLPVRVLPDPDIQPKKDTP